MAPARTYPIGLRVAVTVILLFSLTFSPSISVDEVQEKKKTLGSRPPGCVNKCMKCRPCQATLVIPPHHNIHVYTYPSSHREDDSYYLLSWKCKCGNRLFQP